MNKYLLRTALRVGITVGTLAGSMILSSFIALAPEAHASLTSSGPIVTNGKNGTVITGLKITSTTGDCVQIINSTNITIKNSEIGPCKGRSVHISGGNNNNVYDSYIHVDSPPSGCCDTRDGILIEGGSSYITIQGNVIAYGESNVLNVNPVSGAGDTGLYIWNQYTSFPCGPVTASNIIVSVKNTSGNWNSYWNGGGCGTVMLTGNTFNQAAYTMLYSMASTNPRPSIPVQPKNCVANSPYTTNTSLPLCDTSVAPDTTPPSTPTNLTATPVSSSQINLSWTASIDNVGLQSYKVYRNSVQIATVTSGNSYSDTGLSASTTYYYTISAFDAAANTSTQSNSASATTKTSVASGAVNVSVALSSGGAEEQQSTGRMYLNNLVTSAATVTINVGDNWQTVVNANPAGTTYLIAAGTHRLQTVSPKTGDKFMGQTGAIMSGARLLTSFTLSGSRWYASGQTQEGPRRTECESGAPRCGYPEDLFINGVPLFHVGTLSAVGPGEWYFDYAADRIYLYDNPAGKKVETSVVPTAFRNTADNVTIENLIIEMHANQAQIGAINGDSRAGWTIKNSEIRLNHGTGLRMSNSSLVENNKINTNGQLGVAGWIANNSQVINNEIAYNNFAHYDAAWEGGGTKWVHSDGLLVKGNYSHENRGPGLWTDIGNINITYDGNRVENNFGQAGIFHEISCGAVIKNNIVKGNGKGYGTNYLSYDSGILISTSKNVEVYNNYVEVDNAHGIGMMNQDRGPEVDPKCGALVTTNNKVHDNSVYYMNNGKSGGAASFNPASMWSGGNLFNNNAYCADSLTNSHWQWGGSLRNWAGFQSQSHEANGYAYTLSNSLCTQMKNANGLPGKKPMISDTTLLSVSLSSPGRGSTVSGTATTISANASDNVGVTSVVFKVDGITLFTDTTSPYSMSWNTTTATNGSHTLTATASDAAGNTTTSSSVTVTVNNTAPSTQSPLRRHSPNHPGHHPGRRL